MRFRVVYSILFAGMLLLPSLSRAQGNLENPTPNSFQSGQGIIVGWYCNATKIEAEIDGTITVQVPYGTLRYDTQSVCGDANNGFGFQINWNNLGDGQHSLRVLADGQEFGRATFTVTTLGVDVLTGASGTYALDFADRHVAIQWSQPLQNFVIIASSSSSGTVPLDDLLGRWDFSYPSNGTTVHEYYDLQEVDESEPEAIILGTDFQDNGPVIAGYVADLTSAPVPYEFFLLDPDIGHCELFLFNKTGVDKVEGVEQSASVNASGVCDGSALIGPTQPMTGVRTTPAPSAASQLAPYTVAIQPEVGPAVPAATGAATPLRLEIRPDILQALVRKMQKGR